MTSTTAEYQRNNQTWRTFDDHIYDSSLKSQRSDTGRPRSFEVLTQAVDSWRSIAYFRRQQKVLPIVEIVGAKRVEIENYMRQSVWGKPCQRMFTELAASDPQMLASIIMYGDLRATLLTYAAESLGSSENTNLVLSTLIPLLYNEDSLIREGAVYGLSSHISDDIVKKLLSLRLRIETSPGVRTAIEEVLS